MTTIHYSGTDLFMGAGLICRQPGDYSVQDVTAETLLANEPDLFSQVADQRETPVSDEGEVADTTPEPDDETTDDSHSGTDEGADVDTDEDTQTEAPGATQKPAEPAAPTKSLSKMNKDELQALAAQVGAEVSAELTADQMREAIKSAQFV